MKTIAKKNHLDGFITTKEHVRRLKKKRPDIYHSLKHPSLRTCVAWNTLTFRAKLGFSQAQLAEKAGISRRSIQYLEDVTAHFSPSLDVLEKVAKALKVEAVDFLKQIDLTKAV
jgi:DNA-binding XRE family transcriptional regulator